MATNDDILDKLDDVMDKIDDLEALLQQAKSIQQICWHCGGDGNKVMGEETGSCPDCGGTGVRPFARVTNLEDE